MTAVPALRLTGLVRRFGGVVATAGVSLDVAEGARHALIGPNGAGKTTLVDLVTGVLRPDSGSIALGGVDVTRLSAPERVRMGLARTFQISRCFPELTPLETIALAVGEREGRGGSWFRPAGGRLEEVEEAVAILERFGLVSVMGERTRVLPYGKRRLLEIAVALACRPRVLLLDEPAAGVPEEERHEILSILAALPSDVTILLVEHDMDLVFSFAERITVLVDGAVFADGPPAAIARDPGVRAVYLGEGE
jgi:ABC-type branched-subunit amino acid transport system ATPase component